MSYLIQQMWLCLLLAALLGALIGWWLAKSSCRSKLDDLDASWQRKLDQKQADFTQRFDAANAPAATVPATTLTEQSSYGVEEVEGIGNSYGSKLRDIGISTTEQLLNQCYNTNGRVTVAEHVGIEDFVVRKWASMCDLMRVRGIDGQISELIVYAGIDSVQDLGKQNANALHSKLSTINAEQNRVQSIPEEPTLANMVKYAQSLNAVMQDI